MTTRQRHVLRHSWVPIALASALALTACGGDAENGDVQSPSGVSATYGQAGGSAGEPAPDPQGNTFQDEGVSGYVDAGSDSESTFALDVDNGSYRVAQAMVAQGQRPPADSVRAEEWVNAFDYGDPAPTEAALAVRAESGVRAYDAPDSPMTQQVVRVAVTAREVPREARPSVNLTLVVDRSGSMAMGNRLGLVKDSLALLTESLRPDDTISVVGFDDQVELVLPPTRADERATVMASVDRLTPRGSTDVEGGLSLGYEQARRAYRPGGVNVVVLCSDGVANVGMTGPDSIAARIAEEGRNGIHLVTVGYGMGNYNDHLMEQLADQGDGFYRYVDSYDEARQVYVEELTSLLAPVADDARTQVEFDPERVASYRLVGYENRAMDDDSFADLTADAGELGAGHHASALYEVRLAPGVEPGEPIGTARVLWKSPGTGVPGFATAPLYAADPDEPMSDSLGLATAVADLASVVKGYGSDEESPLTLEDVRARAVALQERDVPGAVELLSLAERLGTLS
jgi:Ca-activated chloride channel family protein